MSADTSQALLEATSELRALRQLNSALRHDITVLAERLNCLELKLSRASDDVTMPISIFHVRQAE
jgi:hypothetical protein